MSENKCFLTDEENCELTDVVVNGLIYLIKEEIAEEYPLKKLKEMIATRLAEKSKKEKEEQERIEKEKSDAVETIAVALKSLGVSKEDFGRFLLGQKEPEKPVPVPTLSEEESNNTKLIKPNTNQIKKDEDDGFRPVDGSLVTSTKVNAKYGDDGIGSAMPAHSSFADKEGRTVREENKRVKKLEDGIVEKSNMGTTVIKMEHKSGSEVDKMIKQVDNEGNLIRAAVSGRGHLSGARTADCNLCGGSGITRIGYKSCPKCGGTGTVTV
jgi:hypothetical protein